MAVKLLIPPDTARRVRALEPGTIFWVQWEFGRVLCEREGGDEFIQLTGRGGKVISGSEIPWRYQCATAFGIDGETTPARYSVVPLDEDEARGIRALLKLGVTHIHIEPKEQADGTTSA